MVKTITYLHICAISDRSNTGTLRLGNLSFPCLLGKNGRSFKKREGDGKSPRGLWQLTHLYFRPDKTRKFACGLPLKPDDGWCDAPQHKSYNRKVKLPFAASHEELWRKDEAYDILGITDHNQRPRLRGGGSAIFLHLWREGATGTEGCIALKRRDMEILLKHIKGKAYLVI